MPFADRTNKLEARRFAWRCRRGMLELDIVLQKFIRHCYAKLTQSELEELDALLELPDNELWQLLQLKNLHIKNDTQVLIIEKLHEVQALD